MVVGEKAKEWAAIGLSRPKVSFSDDALAKCRSSSDVKINEGNNTAVDRPTAVLYYCHIDDKFKQMLSCGGT